MFCRKCGKELSDGVKFCPACGEKIKVKVKDKGVEPFKADEVINSNKDSEWAVVNELKAVPKIVWLILLFVAILAAVVGVVTYYKNNIRDSLKDFEYNSVVFTDSVYNMEFSLYFGEDEKIVESYTSDSTSAYSVYPADGKMWCVNGYQSPWECVETIPEKELFTALLYDIPSLKSKYSDEMKGSLFDDEQLINTENIDRIRDMVRAFDMNTEWGAYDLEWANVEFEGKDLIIVDSNIRICYTKTKREDVIDTVKQRIKEVYGSGWLTGEYHPNGDNSVNVSVPEDNIYVEDDYTVSIIADIDGEEKHFPYESCDWIENGCILGGEEYTLDEEYVKSKEIEAERDRLYKILSGGDFYVHWGTNDDESLVFKSIYVQDGAFCVDAAIGGETKRYYLGEYGGYIGLIEADSEHPKTFRMMKGLKKGAVDYHRFYPVK